MIFSLFLHYLKYKRCRKPPAADGEEGSTKATEEASRMSRPSTMEDVTQTELASGDRNSDSREVDGDEETGGGNIVFERSNELPLD